MPQEADSQRIQLLPEHIIDQIKAGEVIERPSTLLKELLENSVDAGSSKIEIEIKNNGLDLIQIKDNGKGIPFEDLDLAFCRHATSKIERFEDIYNLFTYGFRGEALASIAAVSKLTCSTNPKDCPEGLIRIEGGETTTLNQDETPEENSGTLLSVRDLFFNTPARMKFIQSKTSEKNQLDKIVKAFLLTSPEVAFNVKWDDNDKTVYPAKPIEKLDERVAEVLKKSRPLKLKEFKGEYDGITFNVFLSRESTRGNAGKSQFIFVNKRLVQDAAIHKIVLNSAQKLWPLGETGHYCAYIDLAADALDVNIHPNKTQVKFYESAKVYSLVSSVIKEGIKAEGEAPRNIGTANQSFSFENKEGLGEVQYRSYEFDSNTSSLDNYFDKLDGKREERPFLDQAAYAIANFGDHALLKEGHKVYALEGKKTIQAWLKESLNKGDLSPTPLLVSQPLRPQGEQTAKKISKLAGLGFEIDSLGAEDYVLRAFPQAVQRLPYREYLSEYLENDKGEEIWDVEIWKDEWTRYLEKAVSELGIDILIEKGIASKLNRDKVKKLI